VNINLIGHRLGQDHRCRNRCDSEHSKNLLRDIKTLWFRLNVFFFARA
jgi:hypothetical protein